MSGEGAVWGWTVASLGAVSSLSLVGGLTLLMRPVVFDRMLALLVSFAAGALLGDAFVHIVPEVAASETGFDTSASFALLAGIIAFFMLEKVLHWHHAHMGQEEVIHPVAVSNLIGEGLHNFVDGAIVAGSFLVSTELGVATAVAVALHEIPQELGDFGILVHAGLEPRRALGLNFAIGLTAVLGGVLTLFFASSIGLERWLLPFTAGAFVYIASTDLLPELHKEPEPGKSLLQTLALMAGIMVMALLLLLE
jgi:zinc and cadmium transporter